MGQPPIWLPQIQQAPILPVLSPVVLLPKILEIPVNRILEIPVNRIPEIPVNRVLEVPVSRVLVEPVKANRPSLHTPTVIPVP